jgi:hypothetical protein
MTSSFLWPIKGAAFVAARPAAFRRFWQVIMRCRTVHGDKPIQRFSAPAVLLQTVPPTVYNCTCCHVLHSDACYDMRHLHLPAQAAAVYAITSAVILAAAFALLFAPQYALLAR